MPLSLELRPARPPVPLHLRHRPDHPSARRASPFRRLLVARLVRSVASRSLRPLGQVGVGLLLEHLGQDLLAVLHPALSVLVVPALADLQVVAAAMPVGALVAVPVVAVAVAMPVGALVAVPAVVPAVVQAVLLGVAVLRAVADPTSGDPVGAVATSKSSSQRRWRPIRRLPLQCPRTKSSSSAAQQHATSGRS